MRLPPKSVGQERGEHERDQPNSPGKPTGRGERFANVQVEKQVLESNDEMKDSASGEYQDKCFPPMRAEDLPEARSAIWLQPEVQ